ncbi:hypothetical protein Lser_V15G03356 [Lactuca serriola]
MQILSPIASTTRQQINKKIVGSIGAVDAGMDLGKEGPLVHIGNFITSLLAQGGPDNCKSILQAPPKIHMFQKACVAVYPNTVQNGIVWFWPNTDPKYKGMES